MVSAQQTKAAEQDMPSEERRWNSGSWATLIVVAALWLAAAGSAYAALRQPTDGWLAAQGDIPPPLSSFAGDWPTPLRVGDRITAVADVPMLSEFTEFGTPITPPSGWQAGGSVLYTVLRDGQQLVLDVPIRLLDNTGIVRAFTAAVLDKPMEWGYFLIGALIFTLRPGSTAARLLFLFGGGHAAVTKIAWAAPTTIAFTPPWVFYFNSLVNGAWGYLILPALLLLVISFPRRTWLVRRFPRGTPMLVFAVFLLFSVFATLTSNGVLVAVVLVVLSLGFVLGLIITSALTLLRSTDPVERAQTAWVLLGIGLSIGLTFVFYQVTSWLPGSAAAFYRVVPRWIADLLALAMPLCLGIAITRYRLFDIEVIIRRTLVYSALTLTLGATYFLSVIGLQALFVRLTGQESALAVVASTLAIAALFGPLRRRVQAFIDRRFFRRKYDAQQVLAQFAARAQQQADLDAVSADLLATVQETLEPENVQLWLRKSEQ
jgi:hypothetical protein